MKSQQKLPRFAIACGGTGGHLFPGLAVARELASRGGDVSLLVSTKEIDQQALVGTDEFESVALPAIGLQGGNRFEFARGWLRARRAALVHFQSDIPTAVLGMGGFTSAPAVIAARRFGARTFLHESNVVPGRANRMLAHLVDECFVGFAEAAERLWNPRVTYTGTPVREQFQPADSGGCRGLMGLDPDVETVLVAGGSQGARAINERILAALPGIQRAFPRIQFIHITGTQDVEKVREAYRVAGMRAVVRPFLTEMEVALGAATVAVSRAGASSIAEFAAMRLPSILIPYPHATGNHQYHNAEVIRRSGGCGILLERDATPESLANEILGIVTNPVRQSAMAEAMGVWHQPDAAAAIADQMLTRVASFRSLNPIQGTGANSRALGLKATPRAMEAG